MFGYIAGKLKQLLMLSPHGFDPVTPTWEQPDAGLGTGPGAGPAGVPARRPGRAFRFPPWEVGVLGCFRRTRVGASQGKAGYLGCLWVFPEKLSSKPLHLALRCPAIATIFCFYCSFFAS